MMETAIGLILTGLGAIITAVYTGRSQLLRKRELDNREELTDARASSAENEMRYRATRSYAVVLEQLLEDRGVQLPARPAEMSPTWTSRGGDDSGGDQNRKAVPA